MGILFQYTQIYMLSTEGGLYQCIHKCQMICLREPRFEFLKCFILDPDMKGLKIESEFQETFVCTHTGMC